MHCAARLIRLFAIIAYAISLCYVANSSHPLLRRQHNAHPGSYSVRLPSVPNKIVMDTNRAITPVLHGLGK